MPAAGARWPRASRAHRLFKGGYPALLAELWAQERDPELNFIVGSLYDSGFVEVDDKEARSLQWFPGRLLNWARLMRRIYSGCLLEWKTRIKRDLQRELQWYELAAAQGNADALANLGEIYYSGTQVPLDYRSGVLNSLIGRRRWASLAL